MLRWVFSFSEEDRSGRGKNFAAVRLQIVYLVSSFVDAIIQISNKMAEKLKINILLVLLGFI